MSESGSGEPSSSSTDVDKTSSVECPTCGRTDFKSKRGMKMHHAKMHGESLRGVDVKCCTCGTTFEKEPHHVDNTTKHFCSHKCHGKHLEDKIELVCKQCEEVYETWPYAEDRSKFCSNSCKSQWLKENQYGENHPCFTGYEYARGKWWVEIRKEVLEEYDNRCQYCGVGRESLDRDLHIHHIIPRVKFDDKEKADDPDNLIPLCQECHPKWEGLCIRPQFISDPS